MYRTNDHQLEKPHKISTSFKSSHENTTEYMPFLHLGTRYNIILKIIKLEMSEISFLKKKNHGF